MGEISKMQRFDQLAEECMGEKLTGLWRIFVLLDAIKEKVFHNVIMVDYFRYGFFGRNTYGRSKFVTGKKKKAFYDYCNDISERKYFDDKTLFVEKFGDYIGRDVLNMKKATEEEFLRFAEKHHDVFVKPSGGHFGLGASVEHCETQAEARAIYQKISGQEYMAEEVLTQCKEMAAFNDTSVNTLRVVTFVNGAGKVEVMPGAAVRIGRKGGIADNFHHGGIGALIDEKTGIIITMGIDQKMHRWIKHPDSGKQIVGFQVPHWDEICRFVKKVALVCPRVHCVGWDVVITEDGRITLIEGNSRPDPDLAQMSDGVGKYDIFYHYMQSLKKQQ